MEVLPSLHFTLRAQENNLLIFNQCIHCAVDLSLQIEAVSLFTASPAELSNYICWSQKPPEAVSDVANIKNFLGEHPQTPLI